ncbi:Replication-associated protein RepC [Vagococcus carniphilus]|uniref:Replication-associated protein RepC n=1 Tax=Vagococcus carniphilus TaxID=218144 RepID=UPI00289017C1|nr:Replication-associated protein RepC [Vagococcus carniphilus]MDT2850189.1 Replication-associated protein RepC [Vagococcus carniphilus]
MNERSFPNDPTRTSKKKNPVGETSAASPEKVFDLDEFASQTTNKKENKVGRPRKNKVYSTIRLQRYNVNRVNALQNTLDFETQDDLIASLIDKIENTLENEQLTMFNMYMKTYTARDNKKK